MKTLLAAILLFALPAMAEFQVPALKNPVNDYANVLTRAGKERVATDIINLKKETGAQAGVLIVNTLDGSSIEEASMAAARAWKLGSTDRDDGVLLVIAVKDHKMRLEVGYGLESIVTDAHARQITGSMKSFLRSGNYDGAVSAAITGVGARIKAHSQEITSKGNSPAPTEGESSNFGLILLSLLGLGGVAGFFIYRANRKSEEEARLARHRDSIEYVKRATVPPVKKTETKSRRNDDDDSFTRGAIVGSILSSSSDYSSSSSSSSDSSSSSSSDWGGGGGDFGGGGSSDSW